MTPRDLVADVVVVGAGPAGIACSVRASELGSRVVLLDRAPRPGGQIWRHLPNARPSGAGGWWLDKLTRSGAVFIGEASVIDVVCAPDGHLVVAESSGVPLCIHARTLVLATGARELCIPFDGWTLPGVLGIGGAQALLKSGAKFNGKRVALAGSGPLMLPVAASMRAAGAKIVLLAEQAPLMSVARFAAGLVRAPSILLQAARYRAQLGPLRYSTGTWVQSAEGNSALESITVTDGSRTWSQDVDILCTGYGLIPNVELAQFLGCDTRDGAVVVSTDQRTSVGNVFAAGEISGIGGAPMSVVEGEIAAFAAASASGPVRELLRRRATFEAAARRMKVAFAPRPELRALTQPSTIVCRCEDVRYGAVRDLDAARKAKLYTRTGMGPCQGRICMPALEFLLGWGADTVRTPVEPAQIRTLTAAGAYLAGRGAHLHESIEEVNP
ncbi:MAG: NAD(P)/FAD-dependent oxidoreductase [Gemmatimonadota bacterium]|nr:NAD(P)/FAD-dependent oxidoreductase [Gemmatimonadota bacterium]